VHEVEDRLLGTVVALKTLNARLAGDASALARLRREVAAARSVTHPNVCRIFDLGSDQGSETLGAFVFLTMEYLPGVTLTKFLTAHGPYAPADALPLLVQLADGLAAAHAAGILHRDLKAENIMLVEAKSGGFRAVIMDFGLAGFDVQDEAAVEHGSGFSGTIAYAAPERIAGGRAIPASDVYSLGLIAHEMLTNRRPIPGASGASLTDGGPIPAAWGKLIRRAIQADPVARFANGAVLAEALRNLNAGSAIAAHGANDPRQTRRRASQALIAGAALALVLVAVARLPASPREVAAGSTSAAAAAVAPPAASRALVAPPAVAPPAAAAASLASVLPAAATQPSVAPPRKERVARRPQRRVPLTTTATVPASAQAVAPQRSLIEQAEDLLAGGDIARACDVGERAVRQAPELGAARAFLGRCYMRLGRTSEARAHYARYLALTPNAPDAPFVRAIVGKDQP
jgi:Flp pilus assembly protein TadD